MASEIQNFDLYDLGSRTDADMYDDPASNKERITATVRRVVGEHADDVEADGFEPMITALIQALTNK